MRPFIALLATLLVLLGPGLFPAGSAARQADGSGGAPQTSAQQEPRQVQGSEDEEQNTADAGAQPLPTTPLEDYEASEQISEDLSVAFPVDI